MQACRGPGHLLSCQTACHEPAGEATDLPGLWHCHASLIAQSVKNLPAMQETWIQVLGQEDPLEKAMATCSSIAWRIPWTEEPGGL